MATLGKVLAIFNVLAAIGFLVLVGKDYGKQQAWSYSALRHSIAITGLPVDADDDSGRLPGRRLADELSDGKLKEIFATANGGEELGGNPVRTQTEEVDRVWRKVKDAVDARDGENLKRAKIRYYLVTQARTTGEREALARKVADPKVPIPELMNELERRFNQAKRPPTVSGNNREADRAETRVAIAYLLTNLEPDPGADGKGRDAWRERVQTVVGLDAYTKALERQADSLAKMAEDAKNTLYSDQAAFESHYTTFVNTLQKMSEDLSRSKKLYDDLAAETAQRKVLMEARKTEVEDEKKYLADDTAATDKELQRLRAIERDLFQLQQKVGQAFERNLELSRELEKLETKP